jgi:hypothetical protein
VADPELPRRAATPPTFADLIAAEAAAVKAGTAQPCGDTCLCHGGHTCARATHPHNPDADLGDGKPRGNVAPHAGYTADGDLVQWTCTDPATRALTADQHAATAAQARADHSRDLLDSIDPDMLRAKLGLG